MTDRVENASAPLSPPPASLAPAALRGWRERFRAEHLGLLLTLSYVFLAAVGLFHEALVFAIFRINIIAYAEPSDFILAALRDPVVVLVNLAALPIVALYYKCTMRLHVKTMNLRNWWMGSMRWRSYVAKHYSAFFMFTVVLYALTFSLYYAERSARHFRAGIGQRIHVQLVADPAHTASDTAASLLLGTTQKFVFLYDPVARRTAIIPTNNIARIIVDAKRPPASPVVAP